MDLLLDLGPPALIAGMVLLLAYAFWSYFFGRGRRQRAAARAGHADRDRYAQAQGWRHEKVERGGADYRFHGSSPGGRDWIIEYDDDRPGKHPIPKLHFRMPQPGRTGIDWRICDRRSFQLMHSPFGRLVSGFFVALVAGLDKARSEYHEAPQRSQEIPAGSAAFRERYVLFGTDTGAARLVDAELERLWLLWPAFEPSRSRSDNCIAASLGPAGLEVTIACREPSTEVVAHLAALGQLLADRIQPPLRLHFG